MCNFRLTAFISAIITGYLLKTLCIFTRGVIDPIIDCGKLNNSEAQQVFDFFNSLFEG